MAKDDDNKAQEKAQASGIDKELIRELAKLLDETGLTEIEIERAGLRVRVGRSGGNVTNITSHGAPTAQPSSAAPAPQSGRGLPLLETCQPLPRCECTPTAEIVSVL